MPKTTDDLLNTLKEADSLDGYLEEHHTQLINTTVREQLDIALAEVGLTKSEVLRRADINDIYGYQLFAGSRTPSRDKLLALCIGMGLSADRTQQLLKAVGFAPLYPKNRRDSIVLFGIQNGQSVFEINTALYDHNENTL